MKSWVMKWISAPVFAGNEEKTRFAYILNTATVIGLLLLTLFFPLSLSIKRMTTSAEWIMLLAFVSLLFFHCLLRRGATTTVAVGMIVLVFVMLAVLSANQGAIRSPSTAAFIFVIIMAGNLFKRRGAVVAALATILAVGSLALADSQGLLPETDTFVSFIQWATFTSLFGLTGYLSTYINNVTRLSLKQAEREIDTRLDTEMQLRKLTRAVEQSPASIVITDLEGRIEYVNPKFCQLTGYTPEEAYGQNPRILKTDLTPAGTHVNLWSTLIAGKEWRGEFVNKKKNGELYYELATISPITNQNGVVTNYLAVKEDITERIKVEEALRESNEMFQLLSKNITDVIWILDLTESRFRYVSPSVERLRGYSVEEVLAQGVEAALIPESLELLMAGLPKRIQAFEHGERISYVDEIAQPCKNGAVVWTETTTVFQMNADSGHLEVYGVSREITERKRMASLIQARVDLLEFAAGHNMDDFIQTCLDRIGDLTGSPIGFFHFVEPDQRTLTLLAWSTRTKAEFCQIEGKGMNYAADEAGIWVECLRQRRPIIHNDYSAVEGRKGLPPGHAPVMRELVLPVFRAEKVVAILGIGNKPTDYTDQDIETVSYLANTVWEVARRKQVEENLSELQSRLTQLSENLEDAGLYVYSHDVKGIPHFEYMSPGMEVLTGVSAEKAIEDPSRMYSLILPEYLPAVTQLEERSKKDLLLYEIELQQRHAVSGEVRWMLLRSTPRRRTDGSTVWYGVQMDITQRKQNQQLLEEANRQLRVDMQRIEQLQEELRDRSVRDPLTGVYNRRYLSETLGREMARIRREQTQISFIMADIDRFKLVNDTYGHQVGDKILVEVVDLIKKNARGSDIVCRYGGEEFLLVLPSTSVEAAARRAEEIRRKVAELIVSAHGKNIQVTLSFGVAAYPDHGQDPEEVIARSDKALYLSKSAGRDRVTVWQESSPGATGSVM